jgi:hypothetical protein
VAIKGKGRTKSRPPARAPRPAPVVRRPPFFARRWVQVVGAMLAGMGIVTIVVWATNGLRVDNAAKARDATAANVRRVVQEWQTTVDGALSKGGLGTTGGGPGQITILPSLSTSVTTLASGSKDPKAGDTATTAVSLVDEGVKTLQGVDLPGMIRDKGLDLAMTNYLLNSKARMIDGLQLYGRVAAEVKAAVEAKDPALTAALVKEANALLPIATQVFNEGYTDYTEALARAGLLQPTAATGLSAGASGAG